MRFIVLLLLLSGCNTQPKHEVTDSVIYWNNQELTIESP